MWPVPSDYKPRRSNQIIRGGQRGRSEYIKKSLVTDNISFGTPVGIYMFKVNNGNTRTRCEMCSKLMLSQVSLVLTLNIFHTLF